MATTEIVQESRRGGAGRVALWVVLLVAVVVGSMFLVVGLSSSGDASDGGFMIALPCAIITGLCVWGLRREHP